MTLLSCGIALRPIAKELLESIHRVRLYMSMLHERIIVVNPRLLMILTIPLGITKTYKCHFKNNEMGNIVICVK